MSLDELTMPTDAAGPAAVETPAEEPAERTRIEYFRAYQAVLASPSWLVNLLWGMLALLSSHVIPIVGWMLWTGYLYECVEGLLVSRGRTIPDFDVNRFGDYLTRGVWPFLVQMLLWIAIGATYVALYVGLFVLMAVAAAVGEEHTAVVFAAGLPLLGLLLGTGLLLLLILLAPLMLRVGLSQDLVVGFKLGWWRDFFRRMWPELLLTTLFVVITATIMTTLGLLFFCVGAYVVWAWVSMANAHISWQLYELYLSRGGDPVPLKPRKLVPSPPSWPTAYAPAAYPSPGDPALPIREPPP